MLPYLCTVIKYKRYGKSKMDSCPAVVIIAAGIIYHCIDRNAWLFIHAGGTIILVAWTIHHFIRFGPRKKK